MYNYVILFQWCSASARCQIRRILSSSKNRPQPAKKTNNLKHIYRDEQKPGTAGMVQVLSMSLLFFIFLWMVVLMLYLSECRSWDPYQYPRIYWRADLCTDLCIEQKPQDHVIFQGCKKVGQSQALGMIGRVRGFHDTVEFFGWL